MTGAGPARPLHHRSALPSHPSCTKKEQGRQTRLGPAISAVFNCLQRKLLCELSLRCCCLSATCQCVAAGLFCRHLQLGQRVQAAAGWRWRRELNRLAWCGPRLGQLQLHVMNSRWRGSAAVLGVGRFGISRTWQATRRLLYALLRVLRGLWSGLNGAATRVGTRPVCARCAAALARCLVAADIGGANEAS